MSLNSTNQNFAGLDPAERFLDKMRKNENYSYFEFIEKISMMEICVREYSVNTTANRSQLGN